MSQADMTPAQMLEAAMEGTLSLDEDGVQAEQPADEQAEKEQEQEQAATQEDELEGAPIASKSGTYSIPYDELVKARERAKAAESQVEQLKAQMEELTAKQQQNLERAQANAQDRADAGEQATEADQNLGAAQSAIEAGVDVDIFGDFSEEAIAKGVATLQARAMEAMRAELRAEFEKEIAPFRQSKAKEVADAHYNAIYAKHPDADELIQSTEFADWQKTLPAFMREGVEKAMSTGTADQINEVFDTFKQAGQPKVAPQQQVQAKPLEVQRRVPTSLSEIAGEPHRDVVQQTLEMASNPAALMEAMQNMTPEQRERVLNSI